MRLMLLKGSAVVHGLRRAVLLGMGRMKKRRFCLRGWMGCVVGGGRWVEPCLVCAGKRVSQASESRQRRCRPANTHADGRPRETDGGREGTLNPDRRRGERLACVCGMDRCEPVGRKEGWRQRRGGWGETAGALRFCFFSLAAVDLLSPWAPRGQRTPRPSIANPGPSAQPRASSFPISLSLFLFLFLSFLPNRKGRKRRFLGSSFL